MAVSEPTIISWTTSNWLTIVLMNALFWVILITGWKLWQSRASNTASNPLAS